MKSPTVQTSDVTGDIVIRNVDSLLRQSEQRLDAVPLAPGFQQKLVEDLCAATNWPAASAWLRDGTNLLKLAQYGVEADTPDDSFLRAVESGTGIHPADGTADFAVSSVVAVDGASEVVLVALLFGNDLEPIAASEIAEAFARLLATAERRRRLTAMSTLVASYGRILSVAKSLHESLDRRTIASVFATDGAAVLGVDRLSVLSRCGSETVLLAATGVSSPEPRANATQALRKLAARCLENDAEIPWMTRNSDKDSDPAVSAGREAFDCIEDSGAESIRVQLLKPHPDAPGVGVAICEQFESEPPQQVILNWLSEQAAVALRNAERVEQHSIPGRLRKLFGAVLNFRTWQLPVILGAICAALVFFRTEFTVTVFGQLQPVESRNVFAPDNGIITDLRISNAQRVSEGDTLMVLSNTELELEREKLEGDLATARARMMSLKAGRSRRDDGVAAVSSAAEQEEVRVLIESLLRQLAIVRRRVADLTVRAPHFRASRTPRTREESGRTTGATRTIPAGGHPSGRRLGGSRSDS